MATCTVKFFLTGNPNPNPPFSKQQGVYSQGGVYSSVGVVYDRHPLEVRTFHFQL
jgi:hypothetical protein